MHDGNDKTVPADTESVVQDRRKFLKKAAKAATVAPAVTLLLAANTRSANATHLPPPGS